MKTRHVFLALTVCAALPASALMLGGCSSAPPVNATVNVPPPPPPQPQPMQQQPMQQQPLVVGAAWVPGGVYDELANNMALRARQFAAGYAAVSELIRAPIRQGLEGVMVPGTVQPGFCYRIIAVGGTGVRDLDLFLYGAQGQVLDQDRATDNYPVLGLQRPLCIPPGVPAQSAQMRVRAYTGSGQIAVQMFAMPYNAQMGMAPGVGVPGMVVAPGYR